MSEELDRLMKAMRALKTASGTRDPKNMDRVFKAWQNSFKTGIRKKKDGGSVESYMKRNDGGMAQKTRMF